MFPSSRWGLISLTFSVCKLWLSLLTAPACLPLFASVLWWWILVTSILSTLPPPSRGRLMKWMSFVTQGSMISIAMHVHTGLAYRAPAATRICKVTYYDIVSLSLPLWLFLKLYKLLCSKIMDLLITAKSNHAKLLLASHHTDPFRFNNSPVSRVSKAPIPVNTGFKPRIYIVTCQLTLVFNWSWVPSRLRIPPPLALISGQGRKSCRGRRRRQRGRRG